MAKHKYRSEREILDAINECHQESAAAMLEAENLDALATRYFKVSTMVEDAQMKRTEAEKLRAKARNLLEVKAKQLGELLSEFRTQPMPFMDNNPQPSNA